MKLLLLGASGFIGKNLLEYFREKRSDIEIVHPSSKELNLLNENDVRDFLSNTWFDVVIDAAVCNPYRGNSVQKITELEQDLRMFFYLLNNKDRFGKLYYFGSGAEYDKDSPIALVTEEDIGITIPKTQYGFAKYIIGKTIDNCDNVFNLRVFGLFGKYENWRKTFISGACCKSIKGIPITIRKNAFFDYLYIEDFCKIMEWFVDNEPFYHTYNLVSGKKIDLISIAKYINEISGKKVPIYVCNEGFSNEYTASNKRLLGQIGEYEFQNIYNSIESLYKYYQSIENEIDLQSLLYQ